MTTSAWITDSLTSPTIISTVNALMGWTLAPDGNLGYGGTGYTLAGNPLEEPYPIAYIDRLPRLFAANPDVVIVEGGGNDADQPQTAAYAAFYAALRVGLPDVRLIVTPGYGISQAGWDGIRDACNAAGGQFVDWGDLAEYPHTSGVRWLTGTGWVSTPQGDGNRDIYLEGGPHTNLAGQVYIGRRFAYVLGANRVAGISVAPGVPLMLEIPA